MAESALKKKNGENTAGINVRVTDKEVGLALMDWIMPVKTGLDVVIKMRSDGIKTPVVMVTTEPEEDKVLMAIKAGATDYLVKPFNAKDIQSKLAKFVQPA